MHTVWKGAVSFGLVNVPVRMFSATEDKSIPLRYIHEQCGTPLSYVRRCKHCEEDVEWEEITKGYEYQKGHFVKIQKEELEQLAEQASKEIKILAFVDLHEIDPIYFQKTYYLSPQETSANAYNLLLESLRTTGKIGIANVSIRSKSSLAAIRVIDGCLAMETIFYPDEIRAVNQVPHLPEKRDVKENELQMAQMLIQQLSTSFDPSQYEDEYRIKMQDLIQKKIAGEEITTVPEQPKTNVIDLMSALQASLEAVQQPEPKQNQKDTPTPTKKESV
ncbi:non-homologous end joining protein Ku [Longirhabdus pacifica]|uniref:non-homologous end joining protein Ku n=1 Tax=Longirhabdus pacifica TaxID=2305227 RepID=UPI001008D344|nr:Ku protein [Longirhabdus pacifica]